LLSRNRLDNGFKLRFFGWLRKFQVASSGFLRSGIMPAKG
jgi:hypothetical protein